MAAHLAGAVAANTTLPVIGIPISCKNTGGVDALWSTVQMPSGIPVATVAIDGAANAAHLAAQILALSDETLADKLSAQRAAASAAVLEKNRAVEEKYNV
jgi:5-(carboxyamino)imidazole ribonucleotide mutase